MQQHRDSGTAKDPSIYLGSVSYWNVVSFLKVSQVQEFVNGTEFFMNSRVGDIPLIRKSQAPSKIYPIFFRVAKAPEIF